MIIFLWFVFFLFFHFGAGVEGSFLDRRCRRRRVVKGLIFFSVVGSFLPVALLKEILLFRAIVIVLFVWILAKVSWFSRGSYLSLFNIYFNLFSVHVDIFVRNLVIILLVNFDWLTAFISELRVLGFIFFKWRNCIFFFFRMGSTYRHWSSIPLVILKRLLFFPRGFCFYQGGILIRRYHFVSFNMHLMFLLFFLFFLFSIIFLFFPVLFFFSFFLLLGLLNLDCFLFLILQGCFYFRNALIKQSFYVFT